jgi:hypothetical protein
LIFPSTQARADDFSRMERMERMAPFTVFLFREMLKSC